MLANELIQYFRNTSIATTVKAMKQYKINCKNFRELRFLNHAPKAKQSPDLLQNIKVAIKFLIYFAIFSLFLSQVNIYCIFSDCFRGVCRRSQ